MKINKIEKCDYSNLIKFISKVFHVNFPKLLPKFYLGNPEVCDFHYGIKENGKFVGAIGSAPLQLKCLDNTINIRAVGMVACHKSMRGKGIMSSMLNYIAQQAVAEDVDCMILGGKRQRYQNYGYTPVGAHYYYTVTRENLKKNNVNSPYKVVLDKTGIYSKEFFVMNNSQSQYAVRSLDEYNKIVSTWKNKCYAILDNNIVVGQIICKRNTINEVLCNENVDPLEVISSFMKAKKRPFITVCTYTHQTKVVQRLDYVSESLKVKSACQLKTINFARMIVALLQLKLSQQAMEDCKYNISIVGVQDFCIQIKENKALVQPVQGQADYIYESEQQANLAFFSLAHCYSVPFKLGEFIGIPHIDQD